MATTTGSAAIVRALENEGVEAVFGVPGGAVLPLFDPLLDSPIRHVLARHEQFAGHMAEGYAIATGKVGVCVATSGPGATNLVTPLLNAKMDSTPIVAITGQVATAAIGTDAFQEAPTTAVAAPVTKGSFLVDDVDDLADAVGRAIELARSGRPGPVLVDVPKDVLAASVVEPALQPRDGSDRRAPAAPDPDAIADALELIYASERPVLYTGGGVIASGANASLRRLAELTRTPVVTTLMARGAIPDDHPLALGMPGMHGTYTAITALQQADLLVAVGTRFDDRVTGDPKHFAPRARVVHIDIDESEIDKVRKSDVAIVSDARAALDALADRLEPDRIANHERWIGTVDDWQSRHPLSYEQSEHGPLKTQFVLQTLGRVTGGDATIVSGVGQHQMWASQFWEFSLPRRWINSGGAGTMGFALPAAIGAKIGRPDDLVFAVDGDGCFQMSGLELVTAASEGIPIKIAVMNNGSHGMVKQWQRLFYSGRLSGSEFRRGLPDYAGLATAMGAAAMRVSSPEEVEPALRASLDIDDRPTLIEFVVSEDEMVFPMVLAGGNNDDVKLGPDDLTI